MKKLIGIKLLSFIILLILLQNINALDIPKIISFQGKLTNTNGSRVNNTLPIEFKIYDVVQAAALYGVN
ncbi:MAG TPA: hypothetical protein PLJ38_08555 [bacterium]|nr:hypothetical protein [bacterium]